MRGGNPGDGIDRGAGKRSWWRQFYGCTHSRLDVLVAEEVNLVFQNIERFVPIVAMRRRACSFRSLLQSDPVALRRCIGSQYRHLCSEYIQCGLMLIGSQDNGLNAHDLTASRKEVIMGLTAEWPRGSPARAEHPLVAQRLSSAALVRKARNDAVKGPCRSAG